VKNSDSIPFDLFLKNGVIYCIWEDREYSVQDVKNGIKRRLELANGIDCPMISDISNLKCFSNRDARKCLTSKEANLYLPALAVIVKNPIQRIYAKLLMKMNKNLIPSRVFNNLDAAEEWIFQLKSKQNEER